MNSSTISMVGSPLVRGRSTVQSCAAAPEKPAEYRLVATAFETHSAVSGRTTREHHASTRGKSVESVRASFRSSIGFVNRWSGVRFPRQAPCKSYRNSGFQCFAPSGKDGSSGMGQRFQQPQKPERSFTVQSNPDRAYRGPSCLRDSVTHLLARADQAAPGRQQFVRFA
jgi:hypothetical protein